MGVRKFSLRSGLLLALVLALSALAGAGCDDAARGSDVGEACTQDSDCKSGLECDLARGVCATLVGTRDADDVSISDLDNDTGAPDTQDDTGAPDVQDDAPDAEQCSDGEVRDCGVAQGECTETEQVCVDGIWDACRGVGAVDEICDGLDNDCDGTIDGSDGVTLQQACGSDVGECIAGVQSCVSATWGPCKEFLPPADEVCDGLDNDCDDAIDNNAIDVQTFYRDADGDQHGDAGDLVSACTAPDGFVANSDDCLDSNDTVYPGAPEVCDGLDNDCNNLVDDSPQIVTWYRDADGDTYGNPNDTLEQCEPPPGYVLDGSDCADNDGAVHPGAAEVCNGTDDDCDAATADGAAATWLGDACDGADADLCPEGTYVCQGGVQSCTDTTGPTLDLCDGVDNDCNPATADGASASWLGTACDGADADLCTEGTFACTSGQQVCSDTTSNTLDVCDGTDNDCNPATVDGSGSLWVGNACDGPDADLCQEGALRCVSGGQVCDDTTGDTEELCGDGLDNDCDGQTDEGCLNCNPAIDADFDGANECDDCDDTNGAVYPGGPEICDGLDNDCDGAIDEDFDVDGDTFSVCSRSPLVRDCDDNDATVYPTAPELCDGKDNDCDGYIDEGCGNCDPVDTDGDGVSECDGDCVPTNGAIYPGATEICDGFDNDCNLFTIQNCDVSEQCNFASGTDECMDDLLCACVVNASGSCNGNYLCTGFCNSSETGPTGDGCKANETCLYDLLRSANIHGCGVTEAVPGTKGGGEVCGADTECRSNNCNKNCIGPGCNTEYCQDYCGSDAYCGTNAVCRLARTSTNMDGRCWPEGGPFLGTKVIGQTCAADSECDHGFCQQTSGRCTEACCTDTDCPGGYTCSLQGDTIDTTYVVPDPSAPTCSVSADCPDDMACLSGQCAWRLVETAPQCVRDATGQGTRQAGAACTSNTQCRSNFCDATLSVCVETCCNDTVCPTGLTCEFQTVESGVNRVTSARICVNQSSEMIYKRK